ncbi:hypothetical protein FA15DRAFT_693917 [Coprinopsis marcescibilis]|uniref:Uncharacterized protein n=1 Tax=Coprinopsis marcescibilis TaxID=230819 RepID=A0A5C3KXF6_COPMA|nr:hypothetical protein FA15DRAFT_693917 [Coprinopsis marcescibilis]
MTSLELSTVVHAIFSDLRRIWSFLEPALHAQRLHFPIPASLAAFWDPTNDLDPPDKAKCASTELSTHYEPGPTPTPPTHPSQTPPLAHFHNPNSNNDNDDDMFVLSRHSVDGQRYLRLTSPTSQRNVSRVLSYCVHNSCTPTTNNKVPGCMATSSAATSPSPAGTIACGARAAWLYGNFGGSLVQMKLELAVCPKLFDQLEPHDPWCYRAACAPHLNALAMTNLWLALCQKHGNCSVEVQQWWGPCQLVCQSYLNKVVCPALTQDVQHVQHRCTAPIVLLNLPVPGPEGQVNASSLPTPLNCSPLMSKWTKGQHRASPLLTVKIKLKSPQPDYAAGPGSSTAALIHTGA